MKIRLLSPTLINQIAAGEVIERPASAVKELVENALDAGASQVDIKIRHGGQSLIQVNDNGQGMNREDLELSVERHATSKLADENLFNIRTLGFRGEALPSIGSVSRLTLTSRIAEEDMGWTMTIEGGQKHYPQPAAHPGGTQVEVRDLFYATPARLKFMKTPATETAHIVDTVNKLALSFPHVGLTLREDERDLLTLPAVQEIDLFQSRLTRLEGVMGKDFPPNSLPVHVTRDDMEVVGYVGVPTLHRGTSIHQYLFVNGRPVKDKLLSSAIRAAYQDYLARDRHPLLALYLEIPPKMVDINVHPAKAEVRFRETQQVRNLLVGAIRHALQQAGHRASTTVAQSTIQAFRPEKPLAPVDLPSPPTPPLSPSFPSSGSLFATEALAPSFMQKKSEDGFIAFPSSPSLPSEEKKPLYFLGEARAQLHQTYIVAEKEDSLVIIDQHAAHERLVYEKLKRELETHGIKRQVLLIPQVVTLPPHQVEILLSLSDSLNPLGLVLEPFGDQGILVRETPALLGQVDGEKLVQELVDELEEHGTDLSLQEKILETLSTFACHGSIRSGRLLSAEEMNGLLRQMETTPHSGQCNHGRPTYVELKKNDLERLFGR